jgi:hypothetical protein
MPQANLCRRFNNVGRPYQMDCRKTDNPLRQFTGPVIGLRTGFTYVICDSATRHSWVIWSRLASLTTRAALPDDASGTSSANRSSIAGVLGTGVNSGYGQSSRGLESDDSAIATISTIAAAAIQGGCTAGISTIATFAADGITGSVGISASGGYRSGCNVSASTSSQGNYAAVPGNTAVAAESTRTSSACNACGSTGSTDSAGSKTWARSRNCAGIATISSQGIDSKHGSV